ncbi:MAG: glycosyltransferase family 4 protein [Synechococcaceae cyanobacterium]
MKVLQILPALDAGGVERGTLELARALVAAGHTSVVVSSGGRLVEQLEQQGSRHRRLPVHRKSPISLLQVHRLRRLLLEERPQILHYRSRVPGWIAYLAWRSLRHDQRPRLVSTVHGFHSVNRYSAVMGKGERVIAVSESIRQHLLRDYPAVDPSRIRVVYRGIDPERYQRARCLDGAWSRDFETAHPLPPGGRRLLLPGRITRLKGHDDFLRLLAALKQRGRVVQGLVAGDTHPRKQAYRRELEQRVVQLGLEEEVRFLGHRSDLPQLMTASDLVLSLSQQPESFGRTVLEALALQTPVAGYAFGGVGEVLERIYPAGLVAAGDAAALLAVVERLLDAPAVPAPVGRPFTLEQMASGTLAVYRELLETS